MDQLQEGAGAESGHRTGISLSGGGVQLVLYLHELHTEHAYGGLCVHS